MRFNVKLHRRIAVTATLSIAVAALLAGCAQELAGADSSPGGSIGVGSPETLTPSPRSTQPVTPSNGVDSKTIGDARDLAVEACDVLGNSGLLFENLPRAFAEAEALADRATAGNASWQYLAVDIRNSAESFAKAQLNPYSEDEHLQFHQDVTTLHDACYELGIPLLEEYELRPVTVP